MKLIFTISLVIAVSFTMYSCHNHPSGNLTDQNKNRENIMARTFKTSDGWGYSIFINDKLFIKQSSIPVIEGEKGFAKEEDAIKTATLVVNKLTHQEKPTIRLEELQQMGIVKK